MSCMPPQTPSTGRRAARATSSSSCSNAVRSGFVTPHSTSTDLAVELQRHVEGAARDDQAVEEREVRGRGLARVRQEDREPAGAEGNGVHVGARERVLALARDVRRHADARPATRGGAHGADFLAGSPPASKAAARRAAFSRGSPTPKSASITAARAAPARATSRAFDASMPPMA